MLMYFIGIRVNRAKKSGMVNLTSSVNSRERSGINTILQELNLLISRNVSMRDIKSKNFYSICNIFFFQAEDGIRGTSVTGVQTCALPILPIFLGQQKPPWKPPRVADTQKCTRAGGKHNDLEDVGLDTYHHTFFEMLGNWSFGDYFKKEAIEWAWELLVERWKFPAQRLYATVYKPGLGEPSEFDQEAYEHWARLFREADLDPKIHVLRSGKADNFWMMGDTGPCGPCSEVHVDLTPDGDTHGALVNKGDARCIEIWNLVFIQFNANPDGSFSPLPAKHVDTGMGFERVTGIIQNTKGFSDFK